MNNYLPALTWLKRYQLKDLPSDLSAGLIVAVMLIPQGMAYAMLAGLPPVIGLYASTVPLFVYALFGSSRQLAVGPVAIVSLLTLTGISGIAKTGSAEFVALAALLMLMLGLIQFLLGLARVGFVVNFLSHSVISGFTSAAAIIIGLSQLKHLLGISMPRTENVFELLWEAAKNLGQTNLITFAIGAISIAILLYFKRVAKRFPAPLLVVALTTAAVYFLKLDQYGVKIVGSVPSGVPHFTLPSFDLLSIKALAGVALTIAFVSFMESIAVAKSIATKEGYKVDANQELVALGLANIAGSMFSAYPVTGGFSRSAVNYQAGAKSPLASMITATLIVLTLLFFTNLFYYLPQAVLAAIVMVAVYGLIDFKEPRYLFKVRKIDGWTLLLTFVATLTLGIEKGILLGAAFSLLVFVWRSAYPHTAELGYLESEKVFRNTKRYPQVKVYEHTLIVRPDASLYFANMAFLENYLTTEIAKYSDLRYLILDFSGVNDIDAVALEDFSRVMKDLAFNNIEVHVVAMKGPVRDLAHKAGWFETYGTKLQHLSVQHALDSLGVNLGLTALERNAQKLENSDPNLKDGLNPMTSS